MAGDVPRSFPRSAVEAAQLPSRGNPKGKPDNNDSADEKSVHLGL
jgi:hypothetical protein